MLIAKDVERAQVQSITVCMDSDYDRLVGNQQLTYRTAWTMGYSWENDVANMTTLQGVLTTLVGGAAGAAILQELQERVSRLEQELQRWTEIDISLCARGYGGLFDRNKPLSAIDMSDPPTVRHGPLAQRLTEAGYHRKPRKVVSVATAEVTRICFGKLVSRALYHTFVGLLRRTTTIRLDYEMFMRLAISETIRMAGAGLPPQFSTHVASQRNAFI